MHQTEPLFPDELIDQLAFALDEIHRSYATEEQKIDALAAMLDDRCANVAVAYFVRLMTPKP